MDRVKHKWNTRRCIRFARHRSVGHAEMALRMAHYSGGLVAIIPCPHCAHLGGAYHVVPENSRFLGGWTPAQFLANLPPLFEPWHADPSRIYPNHRGR